MTKPLPEPEPARVKPSVWPEDRLVVRPAQPADYRRIVSICFELGGVEGHLSPLRGPTVSDLRHNRHSVIRANLERLRDVPMTAALVAELGGAVVGYVILRLQESPLGGLEGQIQDLAVTQECWGKGVARRLMEAAEAHVEERGGAAISIQVFSSNVRALKFCSKTGFLEERKHLVKVLRKGNHQRPAQTVGSAEDTAAGLGPAGGGGAA